MSDWSSGPLAEAADWPEALRTAAAITTASCFPSMLLWGPEGLVCAHNDAFRTTFAPDPDPSRNSLFVLSGWSELRPPLQRALGGEKLCCREVPLPAFEANSRDAVKRWFDCSLSPLRADSGEVLAVLATLCDRTDRVAAELQLNEARHRARNTLAALRSILRRTAETAASVEDFAMHLEGRLDAIARVQMAAANSRIPGSVDLANLVAEELDAAVARLDEDAIVDGPDILLTARAGERLALAIHELATNAIQYGALAEAAGRIDVRWRIEGSDGASSIALVWKESGLKAPLMSPSRNSFGMTLLRQSLPYELGARVDVSFERDGLRCTIDIPVTDAVVMGDASRG